MKLLPSDLKRRTFSAALVAFVLLIAAAARAQDSRRGEGCAVCHADAQTQHKNSVHGRGGAICVDCHGGDASARTEAAAHGGDFRGKIARAAVPRLCADCHSDVRRMLPFGLQTDQFKMYAVSRHGEAVLGRGATAAAVCTDCHGVHDPRRADDPHASTHPLRQPATCDRCHADQTLMTSVKLGATTGKDYVAGAHGRALAAGNKAAPSCADCHGAHGTTAPGAAETADVCGRCHTTEKADFLASPHGAATAGAKPVRCVDCHAPHATHASGDSGAGDVVASCNACHAAGSPEAGAAVRIKELVVAASTVGEAARRDLERAAGDLTTADRARHLLAEVVPGIARVRAAAHSLDLDGVKRFAARLEVVGSEARELAARRGEVLTGRRILAAPIAMAVAGLIAGLLMLRGFLAARRRGRPPEDPS